MPKAMQIAHLAFVSTIAVVSVRTSLSHAEDALKFAPHSIRRRGSEIELPLSTPCLFADALPKLIFSVIFNELEAKGFPGTKVDVDPAVEAVCVSHVLE